MRVYENEIVVLDLDGLVLRRHERAKFKGDNKIKPEDRIFNPSRETTRLIERIEKIGPQSAELARRLFSGLGRQGHGAIYGLSNLTRDYRKEDIEAACNRVVSGGFASYKAVKRILERGPKKSEMKQAGLKQSGSEIRPINDYQTFWEMNSQANNEEEKDGDVYH